MFINASNNEYFHWILMTVDRLMAVSITILYYKNISESIYTHSLCYRVLVCFQFISPIQHFDISRDDLNENKEVLFKPYQVFINILQCIPDENTYST